MKMLNQPVPENSPLYRLIIKIFDKVDLDEIPPILEGIERELSIKSNYTPRIIDCGRLSSMFIWYGTPEGDEYWRRIARLIGEAP